MVIAEDIARDVERAARARGVWWDGSDHAGSLMLWTDAVSALRLSIASEDRVVDWPTAAIILLGHARGLRVDLGECSACRARGSNRGLAMWEWQQRRPTLLDNLALGLGGGSQRVDMLTMKRACPACAIDGEPTGRHLQAWERAIIDSMPRPCPTCESWGDEQWRNAPCPDCNGSDKNDQPGDPATRTALTILAHRLADPEHAAVFGDWLAEDRDPAAFPAAPRGGLAAVLHAWLAGPCRDCDGTGEVHLVAGDWLARSQIGSDDDIDGTGECPGCAGHGAKTSALAGEIVAMLREISQAAEQDAIEAAQ